VIKKEIRVKEFSPKNIIVRMPNWIGDVVMATPILTDLRKKFPKASITAMCQSNVASVLKFDPAIDELFSFTRSKGFFRRMGARNVVEKLRKGKYDLGILLTNSFSSSWRFWQGKVKNVIGFKGNWRSLFLDQGLTFPENRKTQHLVLTYKELLKPLDIPISETAPKLYVTDEEIEKVMKILARYQVTKKNKIIGINPGAAYGSAKCYLPERFKEVAEKIIEKDPLSVVVFVGDISQKKLIGEICQGIVSPRVINLAGLTNLRELMALIKIAQVFLTNDSGPMHIADGLQTPLVALFGSTDPVATGPYGQMDQVIQHKVKCAPCFLRTCPIDFACMKSISVEEVLQKVFKCLS